MNLNDRPNVAFPKLTEELYASGDRAREALNEYLQWTPAADIAIKLVNLIEYTSYITVLTVGEIGSGADNPAKSASFELEGVISQLAELTAALSSVLDGVKIERFEYCKGNCPIYRRIESGGADLCQLN